MLAEIIWTLKSYCGFDKENLDTAYKSILNLRGLKIIDRYDHAKAAELFASYPVPFVAALIASDPSLLNKKTTLVTYDLDFDKLPVIRKEPNEAL